LNVGGTVVEALVDGAVVVPVDGAVAVPVEGAVVVVGLVGVLDPGAVVVVVPGLSPVAGGVDVEVVVACENAPVEPWVMAAAGLGLDDDRPE
jgi:hypothetical protein